MPTLRDVPDPPAAQTATQAQAQEQAVEQALAQQAQAQQAAQATEQVNVQPPPADAPPAPGAAAPFAVNVPGMGPVVPMTRDQVRAFDRRGELLSDQLQSAQGRRKELIRELSSTTSPAVKTGIEERIRFLDERLLSLEKDISENSAMKASVAANLRVSSSAEPPPAPSGKQAASGGFFGSFYGIALVIVATIAASRFLGRRRSSAGSATPSPETEARLQQVEQAIDAVAIEIERVSEGQRFITKMLREGQPIPDFAAGRSPEAVGIRRDAESPR